MMNDWLVGRARLALVRQVSAVALAMLALPMGSQWPRLHTNGSLNTHAGRGGDGRAGAAAGQAGQGGGGDGRGDGGKVGAACAGCVSGNRVLAVRLPVHVRVHAGTLHATVRAPNSDPDPLSALE